MNSYPRHAINTFFYSRSRGTALMEVALSASMLIVLAAVGSDITLVTCGMTLNDSTCRDATRAAAQQSTSAAALSAAQAQLKIHATDGVFVSQPILVSTSSPNFVYNDYGGSPPANTSPYVTVTTSVNVKLPAPIVFLGATFSPGGYIQFIRSYTYPIIKEKFYG